MSVIQIESIDDPRVESYCNLKMKNLRRGGQFFIAEGKKVVERLLDSDFQTASVFISQRRLEEWQTKVPDHVTLFVAPQDVMNQLIGFDFHVGVVGCGIRRSSPSLEQVLFGVTRENLRTGDTKLDSRNRAKEDLNRAKDNPDCNPSFDPGELVVPGLTVVACPNCDNPENLGAIVRISAAFGIDGLLLGTGCCDPYGRRVIRVSMGTAFKLPIIESRDLARDLSRLKQEWQFELAGTVLEENAERLESARRGPRLCILMGNEDTGLDESWTRICDRRLTIPMCRDTDSLNVAVAAGIVLHHFTR